MLEHLKTLPSDPILGLMARFRDDPHPAKIDLGVGVYKDEHGETPVMRAVRAAEQALLAQQRTKSYVGPGGNAGFCRLLEALTLGAGHEAIRADRARTLQTPGGCGALRLAAELVHLANPAATIHVSDPTWANHVPLLTSVGLRLASYPYYDRETQSVSFEALLATLEQAPERDVVLVHGCCHNPTGADLTLAQWEALAEVVVRRRLLPLVDIAYQGLGDGLDADVAGARLLAQRVPEALIATSCSKNFGLYRERVGALTVIGEAPAHAQAAYSQLLKIARGIYSMPPDHGASIVERILADERLGASWREELGSMCARLQGLRRLLAQHLEQALPGRSFAFLVRQRGMFSLLPLPPGAAERLAGEHHVYMTADGRTNVAGVSEANVDHLARSVAAVLRAAGRG